MVEGKKIIFNKSKQTYTTSFTPNMKRVDLLVCYMYSPYTSHKQPWMTLTFRSFSQKLDVQNFPRRGHEPRRPWKKTLKQKPLRVATFRDRAILRDHQVQVATQCIDLRFKGQKVPPGFLGWIFITLRIQICPEKGIDFPYNPDEY